MKTDKHPRDLLRELAYKNDLIKIYEAVNALGIYRPIPLGETFDLTKPLPAIWPKDIGLALVSVNFDAVNFNRDLIYYLLSLAREPKYVSWTLHIVVRRSNLPIARMLLEHGADPNFQHNDQYPLSLAAKTGDLEMIDLLVKYGAKVSLATDAVTDAAGEGRSKMVKHLIKRGFSCNENTEWYALYSNHPPMIDALREAGVAYTNMHMQDEDLIAYGKSLSHLASLGFPLHGLTVDSLTRMHGALRLETLKCLKEALENNAVLDPKTCDTRRTLLTCVNDLLK